MPNALLGLPSVVVGLVAYLLLSRADPLGLLFTWQAMVFAQVLLTLPIVVIFAHRATETDWTDYRDSLLVLGASRTQSISLLTAAARGGPVTVLLAACGRAIAEIGLSRLTTISDKLLENVPIIQKFDRPSLIVQVQLLLPWQSYLPESAEMDP